MTVDWSVFTDNWPRVFNGLALTIGITLAATALSIAIGFILAVISLSKSTTFRVIAKGPDLICRSVPFINLMYILYFGLPVLGFRITAIVIGIAALALYFSAYFAEIIRAAILAIPRGQFESGKAIGFSRAQTYRYIIIPQLVANAMPSIIGMMLTTLKESSVLSTITVAELTYQGLIIQNTSFAPFESFALIAAAYWAVSICFSLILKRLTGSAGISQAESISRNPLVASFLSFERRPTNA
ncbi:amino acid ABC transporter permease [Sinorhizobium meliloti]|uniref:amino acid ABC transporter permease n=1 Tax=Rhizobium meliloti TaxID=382 RepID=UPI003D65D138